jgi:tetratricopeptide (TPR) repeat protein
VRIDPDALRQARRRAGFSLAQVAAGLPVTRQAVQRYEAGMARPRMATLRLIAERLDVPVAALLAAPELELPDNPAPALRRLCDQRRYDEVVAMAQRLLSAESADTRAHAHLYAGLGLLHLARPDEAIGPLQEARRLFEQAGDAASAAEAIDWEAGAWYFKEDRRGLELAAEALERYRALEHRDAAVEARMTEHLATQLARHHDYTGARALYERALQVAGCQRDLARLARLYHGLSRCLQSLGDMRWATELGSRAVVLYAVEDDVRPAPARTDVARAENDLGLLFLRQGRLDRAEECFYSALQRLKQAGAERLWANPLLSLAELRQRQGRLDEAVDLIAQATELAERFDEPMSQAAAHEQMGQLHAERGEHELCDAAFARALGILERAGLRHRHAECRAAHRQVQEAREAAARQTATGMR